MKLYSADGIIWSTVQNSDHIMELVVSKDHKLIKDLADYYYRSLYSSTPVQDMEEFRALMQRVIAAAG